CQSGAWKGSQKATQKNCKWGARTSQDLGPFIYGNNFSICPIGFYMAGMAIDATSVGAQDWDSGWPYCCEL
ncbi:hypothetical protein, partial [Pectobacterium sp. B2J-2]|uniref:hypothetical protein n=1 Tax=Pectobacterium sp. B2J-2 TaxID=3385372 RepID=UPI0038FC1231